MGSRGIYRRNIKDFLEDQDALNYTIDYFVRGNMCAHRLCRGSSETGFLIHLTDMLVTICPPFVVNMKLTGDKFYILHP